MTVPHHERFWRGMFGRGRTEMIIEKRQAAFARYAKGGNTALAGRSYDGDNVVIVAGKIFFLAFITIWPR